MLSHQLLLLTQVRSYAGRYTGAHWVHPIFRKEDVDQLRESGEIQKYAFVPIRPANNDQTASVFYDALFNKVVNHIMREGRKEFARGLLEKSFQLIKEIQVRKYYEAESPEEKAQIVINPWEMLHKAVDNSKPFLETTPIKRGGHTYQVPVPVRENKQQALAIKWLVEAGKNKESEMPFYKKFAFEIIEAANGSGQVIKRKQDLHRRCEANRAYAHYRWS